MSIKTPLWVLIPLGILSILGLSDLVFTLLQPGNKTNGKVTRPGEFVEKGMVVNLVEKTAMSHEVRKASSGEKFEILVGGQVVGTIMENYIETGTGFFSFRSTNFIYAYSTGDYTDGHKVFHLMGFVKSSDGTYRPVFDDPKVVNIVLVDSRYVVTKLARLKSEMVSRPKATILINLDLDLDPKNEQFGYFHTSQMSTVLSEYVFE